MAHEYVDAALFAQLPKSDGVETSMLKLVLVAICQHADRKTGECWPSYDRLTMMTQTSKSTVSKAVHCLHSIGVFSDFVSGTSHNKSRYVVDLNRLREWDVRKLRSSGENVGSPKEQIGSSGDGFVRLASSRFVERTESVMTDSENLSVESVTRIAAASPPVCAPHSGESQKRMATGVGSKSKAIPNHRQVFANDLTNVKPL